MKSNLGGRSVTGGKTRNGKCVPASGTSHQATGIAWNIVLLALGDSMDIGLVTNGFLVPSKYIHGWSEKGTGPG